MIQNLNLRGLLISKVTILKSTHLINIYSFWNCLSRKFLLIRLIIITLLIIAKKFKKNSQNSLMLFFKTTPWYRQQIKILPLWYHESKFQTSKWRAEIIGKELYCMLSYVLIVGTLFIWFLCLYSWFLDRVALMNNIYFS